MKPINFGKIPAILRAENNWVLWKNLSPTGMARKVPYGCDGNPAKADDPSTWYSFDATRKRFEQGGYTGIGFEFGLESDRGALCGVDLDGCRDPVTGVVSEWARTILLELESYAEVSPSETGVKIFLCGPSPFASGRKVQPADLPKICDKVPAIEIYDWGRYFAVTGWQLKGPTEPQERSSQLARLASKYFPAPVAALPSTVDFRSDAAVLDRAKKYLDRLPPAIAGQGGHGATFYAACVLVLGFGLPDGDALSLLGEYNQRCSPPWSARELRHKIDGAAKQPGERNYLRNANPERWQAVAVPKYQLPPEQPRPPRTTLLAATQKYLDAMRDGNKSLVETGLPDLDSALAGGVEFGEFVIFAARPSHGKSAVALQCVHHWTSQGNPCLFVSEEMSALALGKRTLQFLTDVPQEHWSDRIAVVEGDVHGHFERRADCFVVESCGSITTAVESIDRHVEEYGVRFVVVDYAQLLSSAGKSRYEQITNVSVSLRKAASRHKIVLLSLCQLNRAIESRKEFIPLPSDLKETGQLEQDADVVVFFVWPHRIDNSKPPHLFRAYVAKNRNRAINHPLVECHFNPSRQMLSLEKPARHAAFDEFATAHLFNSPPDYD